MISRFINTQQTNDINQGPCHHGQRLGGGGAFPPKGAFWGPARGARSIKMGPQKGS